MTPTPVSRRRFAHCLRRFSSGPAGARSNLDLSSQTVQEPSLFNIDYNDRINPFMHSVTIGPCALSHSHDSSTSSPAKSP